MSVISYDYAVGMRVPEKPQVVALAAVNRISGGTFSYARSGYYLTPETGYPIIQGIYHGNSWSPLSFSLDAYVGGDREWFQWIESLNNLNYVKHITRDLVMYYTKTVKNDSKTIIESKETVYWDIRNAFPVSWRMEGFNKKDDAIMATLSLDVVYSEIDLVDPDPKTN